MINYDRLGSALEQQLDRHGPLSQYLVRTGRHLIPTPHKCTELGEAMPHQLLDHTSDFDDIGHLADGAPGRELHVLKALVDFGTLLRVVNEYRKDRFVQHWMVHLQVNVRFPAIVKQTHQCCDPRHALQVSHREARQWTLIVTVTAPRAMIVRQACPPRLDDH